MRYVCAIAVVAVLGIMLVPAIASDTTDAVYGDEVGFSISWYYPTTHENIKTTTSSLDLLEAPDITSLLPEDYEFVGWFLCDRNGERLDDTVETVTMDYILELHESTGWNQFRFLADCVYVSEDGPDLSWVMIGIFAIVVVLIVAYAYVSYRGQP